VARTPVAALAEAPPVAPTTAPVAPETRANAAEQVTRPTPTAGPDLAGAWAERVRSLNEPFVAATRQAGLGVLDGYESLVRTYADYEERLAERAPLEWVAGLTRAHANLTRRVAGVSADAARQLLKA